VTKVFVMVTKMSMMVMIMMSMMVTK